jgi:hypothetical protein
MKGGTMAAELLGRDPDVIAAELDGKALLLNLRSWTYVSFNQTGERIWHHLEEPLDRDTLVRRLAGEFEADEAALEGDVDAFLRELDQQGFLARQ